MLYLVDLSSYVLRAYHAIAPLSSPSGELTQAVHGTVSMLERLLRERRPMLFAAALDSGRETFRKDIFPGYKANRPPSPEDLCRQLERCEQVVRAFNVAVLKQDGVEADDLIASCVREARAKGIRVVIVAADKDLMQLVGSDVVLYDTMRDRVFGVPEVEERFGVRVDQVRDWLALTGDSSDNIPGVPSVGPKTAKELLNTYGTLEQIYQNLEQIQRKALREALTNNREQAFMSQRLVSLKEDCPCAFDLIKFQRPERDIPVLKQLYAELGFHRQLAALESESAPAARPSPESATTPVPEAPPTVDVVPVSEYSLVTDIAELRALLERGAHSGRMAVEVLTDVPSPTRGRLVGIALAVEPGRAHYVPLAHRYVGVPKQIGLEAARELLAPYLGNPELKKLGLDLKRCAVASARAGMPWKGFGFDAALASYLLDPEGRHDRESLVQRELGLIVGSLTELTKRGRGHTLRFDEVPVEEALTYAAGSADFAQRLAAKLGPRLGEEGLSKLYDELELPLTAVLTQMELTGVRIDAAVLAGIGKDCELELQRLEKEAHRIAGRPFNVNSPRQLEALLFDDMGLKPLKRTKTSRSTDAATLEALADQHEMPRVILEIRQVSKLKGTYIDALPSLIDPVSGRIHTVWEQTVAATGRLSSTDPNLQNIPIRTELGRKIRAAFTAPEGYELVSADYSQIELRVLAHLSQDPVLLDAFQTGQDIHTRTAMEIFEVSAADLTREHRTRAKAVNFGVIYGQGDSGLSKVLSIPRVEASNFIAAYFRRYQGVRKFMSATLDQARAGQAVQSLLGRRRLLPEINSANRAERLSAERIAMNMPIQGTAADIIKLAMLAVAQPITPGARLVLTVHDELVFEVPSAEVVEAKAVLKQRMEAVLSLAVPLVVDVGQGVNWQEAH